VPTLLVLHGLTDSGAAWADVTARWSPTHRVLAPDLLGHGSAPRFTAEQLAAPDPMEEMLGALVRWVEAGADEPVVAVGHSMGGGLAAALGARRPDLVRALVLEDPAWFDDEAFGDPEAELRQRLADSRRAAADVGAEVERGRREHPRWPESELLPWAESSADFDLGFGATGRASLRVPWRDVARALARPTLVVTGTEGVILGPAVRAEIDALGNPAIEVAVVPGAGHCVRRDDREAFHALVDPWIAARAG
jgi:pimeloyl-ACP methyl ester carboxylesterase